MVRPFVAEELQIEQGWTDTTLLGLCLDYIGNQNSDDAFKDFLQEAVDSENAEMQNEHITDTAIEYMAVDSELTSWQALQKAIVELKLTEKTVTFAELDIMLETITKYAKIPGG